MAQKKNGKPIPVESTKHKDTRVNIPTEELRNFVREDELTPKTMLYPRDPSLDPQLVWKGKDEQDAEDLAVPTVPIYIQEKIHPQALVENLRDTSKAGEPEPELMLFDDFNGISDFGTKVDFYNHEQHWTNRMILGDSLLVMNSLAEKEGLKGKVQMIYIDPPYGVEFRSNWQVSTRKRDVKDGKAEDATRQPEQIKAFRDTWKLGIHSYLSYLRDRLATARELLTETGSVFVQIGDENVHVVRCLMEEVLGPENFCGQIAFAKTTGQSGGKVRSVFDYLLWFAKDINSVKVREILEPREPIENPNERYVCVETPDGKLIDLSVAQKTGDQPLPEGRIVKLTDLSSQTGGDGSRFPISFCEQSYTPSGSRGWSTSELGVERVRRADLLSPVGKTMMWKYYRDWFRFRPVNNIWMDLRPSGFGEKRVYVVQTTPDVVARCILMTTDTGDLVLDPTCGSGTTAYVAEQLGRRWITVDTSRVALALARTRLMSAKYPYYLLADSPEGVAKESEVTGVLPSQQKTEGDIKKGFVYKRVPHVTLKAIANNEEIDTIHARWQEKLEPVRAELNKLLEKSWEEWEIPREAEKSWTDQAKKLLDEWWRLRQGRQKEIDASIARNADTELLYDQPYEDNKRVRVTGPFTVESLSPHRKLVKPKGKLEDAGTGWTVQEMAKDDYHVTVIENLRKAGVQNTIKNERLKFDRLATIPDADLHASGEYTESGESKRVAVWVGPEFSSVGGEDIRHAAKEAVKGIGFDTLIVCGFAFEPSVTEEAKQYGNLNVLIVRMNPDLMMGDELLKKTGAANLFMIFGEPDISPVDRDGKLVPGKDGKLVVEIKGLDIYDPTTGEIRSNSTDDIACWFIDTDYDGESFFVRHAYFTGADQPYERLRKALKAEINEEAWSSLYRTISRPFDPPENGRRVAVKVINHYGDEVLKVYEVANPAG